MLMKTLLLLLTQIRPYALFVKHKKRFINQTHANAHLRIANSAPWKWQRVVVAKNAKPFLVAWSSRINVASQISDYCILGKTCARRPCRQWYAQMSQRDWWTRIAFEKHLYTPAWNLLFLCILGASSAQWHAVMPWWIFCKIRETESNDEFMMNSTIKLESCKIGVS